MPVSNATLDRGEAVTVNLMDKGTPIRGTVERCDALGLTFVHSVAGQYECVFVPWHRIERVVIEADFQAVAA